MSDDETENHRIRCWRRFLAATQAYIDMKDRNPGLDLLAEIRVKHGPEVAERAKREMNNWVTKRVKSNPKNAG